MNIDVDELREFLTQWVEIESKGPFGEIQQRERLQAVAEWVARQTGGDFVEIGCLHGSTTVMLAKVAREFGRRVIAIDPWEIGTQNCDGGEYEIFCQTVAPYADVIDVMRMRSDDPRVEDELRGRQLAFAFVDGLHTFADATRDIELVSHAAVRAVDDTNWSPEVRKAWEGAETPEARIAFDVFRESWIV